MTLHDALYVPELMFNLIGVSRIRKHNCRVIIDIDDDDSKHCLLLIAHEDSRPGKLVAPETYDGLYRAVFHFMYGDQARVARDAGESTWHRSLGHCIDKVLSSSLLHVRGIKRSSIRIRTVMHVQWAILQRKPCKSVAFDERAAGKALERIYPDVVGPTTLRPLRRSRYFVSSLDLHSSFSMVRITFRNK